MATRRCRDLQVTTEGDVFAIWTAGFPSINHSASLTDNLGTTYLQDEQGHGYFQAKSWPCAWFIPVAPPAHQPASYVLSVTNGHHSYMLRVGKPMLSGSADPTYPVFEVQRGEAGFMYPEGTLGEMARQRPGRATGRIGREAGAAVLRADAGHLRA
jgi:hypothetical protein